MSTTKHLALQKLEPIDMALRDAIAPRHAESRVNSSIISTNAVDKAAQFTHMTRFCSLEPAVQCLHLAFFEHGHKFLAQQIDGVEVRTGLTDRLNLLLLLGRQFLLGQNHQEGSTPRGKTPLPPAWCEEARFARFSLPGFGRQFCAPLPEQSPE